MSFMGDYLNAWEIWRDLTPAQRKALLFPWRDPHPLVIANLTARDLWDDEGPTRSGLAVALCRYIGARP